MESLSNVIAKIQKLRALSINENVHEASSAAAAANKLIEKHQLSEMDLEVRGEKTSEPVEIVSESLYESGRVMLWVHNLAQVLCEANGCSYYVRTEADFAKVFEENPNAKRGTYKAFKIVGRKSDTEIVRYFFSWLREEIIQLTKKHAYGAGMKYSQNFAIGCVEAIKQKLNEQHRETVREAQAQGQSQAMILLDNRAIESESYMNKTLKLKAGSRSHLRSDADAFQHGKSVGSNISLNKGLGAADTNRLK